MKPIPFILACVAFLGCVPKQAENEEGESSLVNWTPAVVFPHSQFTEIKYHAMEDGILIEFGSADSFTNHCDPESIIASVDGRKIVTVTVHGRILLFGGGQEIPNRIPRIESGNYSFAVEAPGFDPDRDQVIYEDEAGRHEIEFAGVRTEEFGPFTPENEGNPFGDGN